MTRTILHVDMDAFFAAIEQHDHPELRGKPVVVGAPPDQRGVVSTASYEARKFGIHSAMPSREAGRLCPHAVFRPVNGSRYAEVSRQVQSLFERYSPFVEAVSIDEAFLDVTGSRRLFGDGPAIARQVKDAVQAETGLTASVGVGPNKFLAKLASDLHKPDGLTVVPEGREAILDFLAPLPVRRIWGVGRVTAEQLEQRGLLRIGDLQVMSERALGQIVGKHGARHLLRLAMGEDSRELEMSHAEKSISREHTFPVDTESRAEVAGVLKDLVDDVGRRLREAGLYGSVAQLKLRWRSFKTITRQRPFASPCCDDFTLRHAAEELFDAEPWPEPVRLIGFGVTHLGDRPERQLGLFDEPGPGRERLETISRTVDRIRSRHGNTSIRRGSAAPDAGTPSDPTGTPKA